ncbi:MAG TPA: PLP-dependent transferase [Methylomirabilota bacterium]|jgi:cystathionine gamma-synthase|nr:PLP-dependent transferase [Methylomirabilota bacterium]
MAAGGQSPVRRDLAPETLAAQAAGEVEPATRALAPPIHPSTIYEREPDGTDPAGRAYTRADNPTYEPAERLLAVLEGGAGCVLFASGSAAATAVFQALLPGDHVLVARVLYWGIRKWLAEFAIAWGLDVEFVDTTDLAAVATAIRPGRTRLLWIETPANPTWEITDLAAVAATAHAVDVRVAVDSTVATPVLTRPIEFGADLVVHSASKYLNGHSDVLAGAVVTARRDPFWERIRSWRRNSGAVLGPFEAWLLQRGMRTLFVRVRRSSETPVTLARHFQRHPALTAVLYPGLPSHPGHDIAARQMAGGFGGMVSIRMAGGKEHALAVAAAVRVFKRATSLGGVESLIEHRRSTEGPSSPVPDDLLRLSIGLEAPADLIADLETALTSATPPGAAGPPAVSSEGPATSPARPTAAAAVAATVERSVAPSIVARGGAVRVVALQDGLVTLEASGSPGAILPTIPHVEALLRTAVSDVTGVRVVWPGEEHADRTATPGDLAEHVRRVLDDEVNPTVAAHRGHVRLVDVIDGRVRIRLEGGCQGCSLAEVTVRQGIERLLRARVPEVRAVVDVTDHQAGTEPFFTPEKR